MSTRHISVWPHATRHDGEGILAATVRGLAARGFVLEAPRENIDDLRVLVPELDFVPLGPNAELAVIFGGDGSILRAAEWALPRGIPLLGVNMGHVGFLAELDPHQTRHLVEQIEQRRYTIEERFTLHVTARDGLETIWESDAINEVSLEKWARERMLEVMVRIDGLPLSRWGCDGVLVSTPTGSTAYAFSAGGPIMWPTLESLLVIPLSAHALFSRPCVVGPDSTVEIELVESSATQGVMWCDGRRSTELYVGNVVHVTRGPHRLKLARLSAAPFTERLVRKFGLPVDGWRGAAER